MPAERPPAAVRAVYDAMPDGPRQQLLEIRDMVFEEAASPDVGELEECLKWGEPSYLTRAPKTGTTLRLACTKTGDAALFTHCQSGVMEAFRPLAPTSIRIDGNRAAILEAGQPLPRDALRALIRLALTYHAAPKATA